MCLLCDRSHISTGDDNIAVKDNTQNVLIENCSFGTGHGVSSLFLSCWLLLLGPFCALASHRAWWMLV